MKRTLILGGYIEAGQYFFFLTDHLGSTHLLADKEAMVYQQVNYYPFGMAFADGVAQDVQPYKFTGKELDNKHKIGIYDSHARMQDTQIPRFLSMDPMAEKYYSWSPYVYCANNPMRYTDPTGKWLESVWDIASISVGGASFVENISQGKFGAAFVDVFGIAVDGVALAIPIVPGGLGIGIKAIRGMNNAVDVKNSFKYQQRMEELAKRASNERAIKMEEAIAKHLPDGKGTAKRALKDLKGTKGKVTGAVVITGVVAATVIEVTNPNPSKDSHESHKAKIQNKEKEKLSPNPNPPKFIPVYERPKKDDDEKNK